METIANITEKAFGDMIISIARKRTKETINNLYGKLKINGNDRVTYYIERSLELEAKSSFTEVETVREYKNKGMDNIIQNQMGMDFLGDLHSHPNGLKEVGDDDVSYSKKGLVYLIMALEPRYRNMRRFRLAENHEVLKGTLDLGKKSRLKNSILFFYLFGYVIENDNGKGKEVK